MADKSSNHVMLLAHPQAQIISFLNKMNHSLVDVPDPAAKVRSLRHALRFARATGMRSFTPTACSVVSSLFLQDCLMARSTFAPTVSPQNHSASLLHPGEAWPGWAVTASM